MMAHDYEPFTIRVEEQTGGGYQVRAEFQGVEWKATIPQSLPLLTEQEIEEAKMWLERGFIDRDYAKDFGKRLFRTLFQRDIRQGFRIAFERVVKEDNGLRIILTLPAALASLPWELMYDEDGGHGFLARSTSSPLVRHFDIEKPPHKLPTKGPLRILLVTASPKNYPAISSEEETEKIIRILTKRGIGVLSTLSLFVQHIRHPRSLSDFFQRIRQRNYFEVDVLTRTTKHSLQRKLVEAQKNDQGYHVVHFIGHGNVDENGSYLVFESETGKGELVSSDQFAEMLSEPTIVLAVLNACQTASATNLFHNVAQSTLYQGVPAVIGMQVPILDRTAVGFAAEFYGAWAAGQPIESALSYARRLIKQETPAAVADWGVPVLFMGPQKGVRTDFLPPQKYQPFWWRFLRWAFASLIALIGILSALLAIPSINKQLRTEVPVIRCIFPYPMGSGFNVVVNDLTVVDENGSVISSRDGMEVAKFVYQQLDFEFRGLDLGVPIEIRPPGHTCPFRGNTPEEREKEAAAIAERINADVIVYGVITKTVGLAPFSPEFYVNYKGFEEGEEITGQHELGEALTIDLPFHPPLSTPASNPALSARTKALSLMTIGLAYYSIDNFENASNYFLQAKNTAGWFDSEGKEVIYLLLGNTGNRQASKDQPNYGLYLDESLRNFNNALSINPNYARAMVGKAGVLYLMALGDPQKGDYASIDLAKLDKAKKLYNAALYVQHTPESANIRPKVNFGLGQVTLARFLKTLANGGDTSTLLDVSINEFKKVIQEYDDGNVRIANLAGHSYAWLGLIARRFQNDPQKAIDLYSHAVELATPFYQSHYSSILGEVYADNCQIELAQEAYGKAIGIAKFYGYKEEVKKDTIKRNEIMTIPCTPGSN